MKFVASMPLSELVMPSVCACNSISVDSWSIVNTASGVLLAVFVFTATVDAPETFKLFPIVREMSSLNCPQLNRYTQL